VEARSVYTSKIDPYRAGIEIAEETMDISPEVLFLFTSVHYKGSGDIAEAIYDIMDNEDLIIVGCSGDGFFTGEGNGEVGASALAINSGGTIRWHTAWETGVGEDPFGTALRLMDKLNTSCGDAPSLYYILSDFRTDTNGIVSALQKYARAPVVGGLAGDTNIALKECYLYHGRRVMVDAMVGIAFQGAFNFDILMAHTMDPVGEPGTVTGSRRTVLESVNDISVMDFIEKELGKPVEMVDNGIITFSVKSAPDTDDPRLRSMVIHEGEHGKEIQIFGAILEGEQLQLCIARPDSIIEEVRRIGESLDELEFKPAAALIVSCAGRKQVLGNRNEPEVEALLNRKNSPGAIAGFPSFGEFGPIKSSTGYSRSLFHNMTYILLLIG